MINPTLDSSFDFSADVSEPGLATRAWRFANVVWLAAYVYAGYKGTQLWTRFISDLNKAELYRRQDLRAAQALNRTALRLEGLLIKACQFIATRADVLPDEWVSTLSGLHDRVPPRPFAMIRDQIERELRRPLKDVYAEFDPVPLASASLAQVHRARLHDGRRCAVKVQYPGIDGIVRADLRNMTLVLRWLAMLERDFDYRVLMREALKYVPMELDFIHEAENSATMRHNFAADTAVLVPEVYREFTTRRVLTMELVEGIKVTDVEGLERAGIDKHAVAQKLIEIFCDQVLRDGFFPRRPASRQHPGAARPAGRAARLRAGQGFSAGLSRRHRAADVFDSHLESRRYHRGFPGVGLPDAQRQSRYAAGFRRSVSRQYDQVEKGLRGQGPYRSVQRGAAARDTRQSRGRSPRRRAAGRAHDGSAERTRQVARLAGGFVHDDHAVRAAPHDVATNDCACR
jgi:hypothetical protein